VPACITGEVERHGTSVSGLAVHVGARVAALAQAGEVIVTGTVQTLVLGSGIRFADRGRHSLKGVAEDWQLYSVEQIRASRTRDEQDLAVRIERSATTISWIPSDSIPGLLRMPFARGIMHYDPPPPLALSEIDAMRRSGELRSANLLGAYIDVDDGRIVGAGYTGRTLMGVTPITAGRLRILLPTKSNREIQWQPDVRTTEATFVQTAGGRPGFSFLKPTWKWPFLVTKPFTIWTTIRLTINVDGTSTQELIGASPFPRHWLYDDGGQLVQKSALTRNQVWARTIFGSHTPWGGEDLTPAVAEAETALERVLADRIMGSDQHPTVRNLRAGDYLFRQDEEATFIALILDGTFEVRVDDDVVAKIGPGTVVGERASLEAGRRTADVRAATEGRVAEVPAESIDLELLSDLAQGHRREDGA
jgi:Cyclic nucleotide-binding domain